MTGRGEDHHEAEQITRVAEPARRLHVFPQLMDVVTGLVDVRLGIDDALPARRTRPPEADRRALVDPTLEDRQQDANRQIERWLAGDRQEYFTTQ